MKNPLATLVSWQYNTGQLDGWTAYHLAAGAFLCKIFQWLHWSDFWCGLLKGMKKPMEQKKRGHIIRWRIL